MPIYMGMLEQNNIFHYMLSAFVSLYLLRRYWNHYITSYSSASVAHKCTYKYKYVCLNVYVYSLISP